MIPIRELRHIIETSFLPMACTCQLNPGGTLTIEVSHPETGQVDLLAASVSTHSLDSIRAINDLVAELRAELKANQEWFGRHANTLAQSRTVKK